MNIEIDGHDMRKCSKILGLVREYVHVENTFIIKGPTLTVTTSVESVMKCL